jgi:hypothetical protein
MTDEEVCRLHKHPSDVLLALHTMRRIAPSMDDVALCPVLSALLTDQAYYLLCTDGNAEGSFPARGVYIY